MGRWVPGGLSPSPDQASAASFRRLLHRGEAGRPGFGLARLQLRELVGAFLARPTQAPPASSSCCKPFACRRWRRPSSLAPGSSGAGPAGRYRARGLAQEADEANIGRGALDELADGEGARSCRWRAAQSPRMGAAVSRRLARRSRSVRSCWPQPLPDTQQQQRKKKERNPGIRLCIHLLESKVIVVRRVSLPDAGSPLEPSLSVVSARREMAGSIGGHTVGLRLRLAW